MSSHPEVMRVCNSIDIDSDLINAAKSECEGLDLDATAAFNIFPPGEKCVRIIDCLKKQISRKATGRVVLVFLPGAIAQYVESTCIAVPIKKEGLPASMITRTGQSVAVNWDGGKAWEVLQDVKPAADTTGGTLLLLRLE